MLDTKKWWENSQAKSMVSPLDSSLNPAGDGAQLLLSAQVFISQF